MTFEEALEELRGGRIEFGKFIAETRPRWKNIALDIMRRWRAPGWMEVEDVEQELHLAAWRFVWEYEEERGGTLAKYVVWNAYDKAKKRVHKARGAKLSGSADRNPGNIDIPFGALRPRSGEASTAQGGGNEFLDKMLNIPAPQEEIVARIETCARVKMVCKTRLEKLVVDKLVGTDSVVDVAMLLYNEPRLRAACRMTSELHACEVVEAAVGKIIVRLEQSVAA